jgi:hypothetical protein
MARTTSRLFLLALLLLGSTAVFAATAGDESMTYRIILFVHQLLLVLWLGPDIGVYMWSTKLTNPECTPAQRVAAARMMTTIDIIPKACMSLMLTVGGTLTELMGIEHPWWQMAGIWMLGPVWLTLTLVVYFRQGSAAGEKLVQLDVLFRWLVLFSVLASVGLSMVTERLIDTPWITGKLLLFAAVVFFSIMMRLRLKPLTGAVQELEATGPSSANDSLIKSCISRSRLFMFATWIALAMAAGLGMVQPGDKSLQGYEEVLIIPAE